MRKWAPVIMLGKIGYELLILAIEWFKVILAETDPCCVDHRFIGAHVIFVLNLYLS